jgi:hypothetical protein
VGRTCTICLHLECDAIDSALRAREPLRTVAARFGTSYFALHRHRHHHLAGAQSNAPLPIPVPSPPAPPPQLPVELGAGVCIDCREPYNDGSNLRCRRCINQRNASTCLGAPPRRPVTTASPLRP